MSDGDRVYTLQQAAERLQMPYRSLRDAVFQGKWPHRYISQRRRLMTESDIAAVLALTAKAPTPAPAPSAARAMKASVRAALSG